jgi:hypothetical protein
MDMLMGNGTINKDNYLTDCANAVVYVRESADKIDQLERALANCKAVAEIQTERVRKLEAELAAMTTRAETAERERDALAKENEWKLASEIPKRGFYLTINNDYGVFHEDYFNGEYWKSEGQTGYAPSYYRELPQPPKGAT